MKLEYVDIFYTHRPDPETPLEETMGALDQAVRSGKALYAGISNYQAETTARAAQILKEMGTPCLIHQPKYSMFERWVESGLLDVLENKGIGCIAFSPLAQGLLTNKYLGGIPADSRAGKSHGALTANQITPERLKQIEALNQLAVSRGQSLAQMAIAWLLKDSRVTSVLIGASSVAQLDDNLQALKNITFTVKELEHIELLIKSKL
jgi:L-glyceraldehyde 3-phosphate reductase